jgi:polyphosphate kinase
MNSLSDPEVIRALYRASQAGVKIELIIRGICVLRPGIPGVSENIRVRSIVGRFLEHARIFVFENAGKPETFLGSADWMSRNFFRRVELVYPVEDTVMRERIQKILASQLAPTTKAWELGTDGYYTLVPSDKHLRKDCQSELIAAALGEASVGRRTRRRVQRPKPKLKPRAKPKA